MALWKKSVLLVLRIVMGLSIIATFATVLGIGIARQAALGGADLGREAETTGGLLLAWLRTGGPVALIAITAVVLERGLSRRWGTAQEAGA